MGASRRSLMTTLAGGAAAAPLMLNAAPAIATESKQFGAVFVMSNSPDGNEIFVFQRNLDGEFRGKSGSYHRISTDGLGFNFTAPVDPLGSQGALIRSGDRLFAVNAGSNSVSAINLPGRGRPTLSGVEHSGGEFPVSIATFGNLLYVLNAGGERPSVGIMDISSDSELSLITTVDLGITNPDPFDHNLAPGQVLFDARNRNLVVVHAFGQQILIAPLGNDGMPTAEFSGTPVPGSVPFSGANTAFGFLLVTEAGTGSLSSFDVDAAGNATLTAGEVANEQMATCWVIPVTPTAAIVSNTASGTLSRYSFARDGGLALENPVEASVGSTPTDLALDASGRFLYVLDPSLGLVTGFEVNPADGSLSKITQASSLPANQGIQGIAAL